MKKSFVLILTLWAVMPVMRSQTYDTVSARDGKLPGYHYSWWYEESPAYYYEEGDTLSGCWNSLMMYGFGGDEYIELYDHIAKMEYVRHPAAITGIGVWVVDSSVWPGFWKPLPITNPVRTEPEYVDIFQYDKEGDSAICVASVQWDTATPRILKVPFNADTDYYGFSYCYLYEVNLATPILVDSSFYLAGTYYNNMPSNGVYPQMPTAYGYLFRRNAGLGGSVYNRDTEQRNAVISTSRDAHDRNLGNDRGEWVFQSDSIFFGFHGLTPALFPFDMYGGFMPKIDYARVRVLSNDTTMGTAGMTDDYSKWTEQKFYAIPSQGCRFSHWEDGSVENPRMARIIQDTTFVAYFEYTDMGNMGIRPAEESAFSLSPNPTDGEVRVETSGEGFPGGVLAVTDASGREVQRHELAPHTSGVRLDLSALPQGTYFVTLRTEEGTSTKKLVLK